MTQVNKIIFIHKLLYFSEKNYSFESNEQFLVNLPYKAISEADLIFQSFNI